MLDHANEFLIRSVVYGAFQRCGVMSDRAYRVFARLAASASATRPEDLAAFTVVRHRHEESLTLDGQPLHCHGVIPVADADEVAYDQILHDTARGYVPACLRSGIFRMLGCNL